MTPSALVRSLIVPLLAGLSACGEAQDQASILAISGGDPERGHGLIQSYGCGTCHIVEGVRGRAEARSARASRTTPSSISSPGFLPNTPSNLIAWLMDPVALKPQTGMPSQGVTEAEARHIAAYLYTLGDGGVRVYPPDPPLPLRGDNEVAADLPQPASPPSETTPRTRRIVPNQPSTAQSGS